MEIQGIKIDNMAIMLAQVLSHVAPQESSCVRPASLPRLPLKTVTEIDDFERYLENATNVKAFVSAFTC